MRDVTLENDLAQKDIIKSYMENEYGQVISGQYSEYASGSGETEEELTMTNIKSIMVTANVKSTDELVEICIHHNLKSLIRNII